MLFENLPVPEQYSDWQSFARALLRVMASPSGSVTQEVDPSYVNWAVEDIAAARRAADANMPDIPLLIIYADHTGAVLDGQLPANIACKRYDGEDDVSDESVWSRTVRSGTVTSTIDADTGILTVTALGATSVIEVASVHNSITKTRLAVLELRRGDPPPSSGAGADAAYDSSIASTTATTYGAANASFTLTCGPSGEIELSAPLDIYTEGASPAGSFSAEGKWRISAAGAGVWSDVGAVFASSAPAVITAIGPGEFELTSSGVIGAGVTRTATGLTPASDYDCELLLRNTTNTRELFYIGTAAGVTD